MKEDVIRTLQLVTSSLLVRTYNLTCAYSFVVLSRGSRERQGKANTALRSQHGNHTQESMATHGTDCLSRQTVKIMG